MVRSVKIPRTPSAVSPPFIIGALLAASMSIKFAFDLPPNVPLPIPPPGQLATAVGDYMQDTSTNLSSVVTNWSTAVQDTTMDIVDLVTSPWEELPKLKDNALYVRGGGFAGFFYTLGWLDANPDDTDFDYYCYSGGCLSVVSHLLGVSLDTTLDTGAELQRRWFAGDLSRYELG